MNDQCILSADIAGSSRLYERLGDVEALRAIERCLHRLERATASHRGRLVKTSGREIEAAFDSASTAIQAAIDMQQRIDDLPPASGVKLAARIGLHWGPVSEEKNDVAGDTVNTASRLANLAKGGQILASAETLTALAAEPHTHFNTREIDDLAVMARAGGVRVFEVVWQESTESATKTASPVPAAPAEVRLRLRHGGAELLLGPNRPVATMGRDSHCDIVIRDARASRKHARIERRRSKFVLVDESTNGTYVTVQGEAAFALLRGEAVLRGRGRIFFGHDSVDEEEEALEFELLD